MARLECPKVFIQATPGLDTVAKAVADSLWEAKVCVRDHGKGMYGLHFEDNSAWFNVASIKDWGNDRYSFYIELISGEGVVWSYTATDEPLEVIGNRIRECREHGFVVNPAFTAFWDNTAHPLSKTAQVWSKFTDNTDESAKSGVVSDGITSVRIVALKYQDRVIAYRFKTNVGAFDMKKAIAEMHGISDMKVETSIKLQSVNGLLMSQKEIDKNVCIPDVSDNEEDCKKLIAALLNVRG